MCGRDTLNCLKVKGALSKLILGLLEGNLQVLSSEKVKQAHTSWIAILLFHLIPERQGLIQD